MTYNDIITILKNLSFKTIREVTKLVDMVDFYPFFTSKRILILLLFISIIFSSKLHICISCCLASLFSCLDIAHNTNLVVSGSMLLCAVFLITTQINILSALMCSVLYGIISVKVFPILLYHTDIFLFNLCGLLLVRLFSIIANYLIRLALIIACIYLLFYSNSGDIYGYIIQFFGD